jgi:hypothetical protein
MRGLKDEGRRLAGQLRQEVGSSEPNASQLQFLIDKIRSNRKRLNALDEERIHRLREGLSPRQQAKLLLLMPRLEDVAGVRRCRRMLQSADRSGTGIAEGSR